MRLLGVLAVESKLQNISVLNVALKGQTSFFWLFCFSLLLLINSGKYSKAKESLVRKSLIRQLLIKELLIRQLPIRQSLIKQPLMNYRGVAYGISNCYLKNNAGIS